MSRRRDRETDDLAADLADDQKAEYDRDAINDDIAEWNAAHPDEYPIEFR